MSVPEFAIGDKVVHHRDVTKVGTVVQVRRHRLLRNWMYLVEWEPGAPPTPMRPGTWRAPGTEPRVPAPRTAPA